MIKCLVPGGRGD